MKKNASAIFMESNSEGEEYLKGERRLCYSFIGFKIAVKMGGGRCLRKLYRPRNNRAMCIKTFECLSRGLLSGMKERMLQKATPMLQMAYDLKWREG